MSKFRKIITTGLIAMTLATAVLASSPASAWYRRYGWYGGGWGWGAPAIAAIGLGALAVGAAAGAGAYPYYGGCTAITALAAIPQPTAMLTRRDFASRAARFTTTGAILSATNGCA